MTNEELEMMRGMQEGVAIRIADLEAEVDRLREERDEARRLSRCLHLVVPESKRKNYGKAFRWLEESK